MLKKRKIQDSSSSSSHVNGIKKIKKDVKDTKPQEHESDSDAMEVDGEPTKVSAGKENLVNKDTPLSEVKGILKTKLKNGVQLTRQERRQLKRANRRDGDLVLRCLHLWESARTGSAADKSAACDKILGLVTGKVTTLAYAHDSVRVLETLLKFGNERHRWTVFEEIKGEVRAMCMSKYARFLVAKLLDYGTGEQRASVLRSFEGHVVRLLRHREAGALIEQAYNDHANSVQRATLQQEFYGPQFALFKNTGVRNLQDALKQAESSGRATEAIMAYQREVLQVLATKNYPMRYTLVQQVLLEFLSTTTNADDVKHLAESLREQLVPMLHTRVGAKCAIRLLWALDARERVQVLRSLKSFVVNVATNEHGYLWLLALLEAMKRAPPLVKWLLKELLAEADLERVLQSASARKVLLYVLRARAPQHFTPALMSLLQLPAAQSAESAAGTAAAAKEAEKWAELRLVTCGPLLKYFTANMPVLSRCNGALVVLLELLQCAQCEAGTRTQTLLAVVTQLCTPFEPFVANAAAAKKPSLLPATKKRRLQPSSFQGGDSDNEDEAEVDSGSADAGMHLVESAAGHFVLKQLLKLPVLGEELARLVLLEATNDTLVSWTRCNRGGFLLQHLVEGRDAQLVELRKRLTPHLKTLQGRARGSKGVQQLISKLQQS